MFKSKKRPVDKSIDKGFTGLGQQLRLISKHKVRTWQAVIVIAFVVGLSIGSIVVINRDLSESSGAQISDTEPPTFTSFTVDGNNIGQSPVTNTDGSPELMFNLTDEGGAGLREVTIWRANDAGGTSTGWLPIDTIEIPGNVNDYTNTWTENIADGIYWYGIRASDDADPPNFKTGADDGVEPIQVIVSASGQTCAGNVPYGQCSTTKPKYCDNGNLVNKCSVCGCSGGQNCQTNGSCLVADTESPSFMSFTVDGKNISQMPITNTDGSPELIFNLTDEGGAGLAEVTVWRANDVNGTDGTWEPVDTIEIPGNVNSFTHTWTENIADGAYWYGLEAHDKSDPPNIKKGSDDGVEPIQVIVSASGQTCAGNVPYGQCSTAKPKYCDNGNLVNKCSVCGCSGDLVCQSDGSCIPLTDKVSLFFQPAAENYQVGQTFPVEVILDTAGQDASGVDLHYLRYNRTLLEVVSIEPGDLFSEVEVNQVLTTGRIDFSQTSGGDQTYNGSGRLLTINFKAKAVGTADLSFDFVLSRTTDTNVAAGVAEDILEQVGQASFVLSTQTCAGNVPYGQCSTAKPKYCDNGNLVNKCSVCGCSGDLACQSNGSCSASQQFSWRIRHRRQASSNFSGLVDIYVYEVGTNNIVDQIQATTDANGGAEVGLFDTSLDGIYDLILRIPGYLTKKMAYVKLVANFEVDFGELKAGDLSGDDFINSLDYSIMKAEWGSSNVTADINEDKIVNSLDFSVLNNNWFIQGDKSS